MKKNRVRELYQQYVGAMEEWQIKLAIARMIHFRVPQEAWPDTMQELAIVVHEFTFDAEKAHAASEETILCRLLDNRIRMLARTNARRGMLVERLGKMSQKEEDDYTPDRIAFNREVQQFVSTLRPVQQQICNELMNGLRDFEIAAITGRHYTTIRRHVRHIRKALAKRGFNTWSV